MKHPDSVTLPFDLFQGLVHDAAYVGTMYRHLSVWARFGNDLPWDDLYTMADSADDDNKRGQEILASIARSGADGGDFDATCPDCGGDYLVNETILPNGSLVAVATGAS